MVLESLGRGKAAAKRSHRRLRRAFVDATTPSASAFGSFGRSHVVPPCRTEQPEYVHIGDGVVILEHMWFSVSKHFDDIDPVVRIGDDVRIGRGCQFSIVGELVIEPRVVIGDFVLLADTWHPYEVADRLPAVVPPRSVRIERGAVLASHVTVLPGVTIGAGAYVDHHAVVSADVPPGAVVAGSPARTVTGIPEEIENMQTRAGR